MFLGFHITIIKMSIIIFPEEVLERIFSYLDGCSFAKGMQVCTRWKDIICNMLRIKNWWKEICLREIPLLTLEELCGNMTIYPDSEENMILDWHKVYKRWFLCNIVSTNCYRVNKLSSIDSTPITCCKLSGLWILTGHRNGSICAWSSENGEMVRIVTQHLKMVTDFALFDLLKTGPYSCSFHEAPCGHQIAVSISKDHNIQVSSLLEDSDGIYFGSQVLRKHSDTLESIKPFDNKFAVLCANNTASVWLLVLEECYPDIPSEQFPTTAVLLYFLMGPNESMEGISFWNNKMCCLCRNGVFKEYDVPEKTWCEGSNPQLKIPMIDSSDIGVPEEYSDNGVPEDYSNIAVPEEYNLLMINASLFCNREIFIISSDHRLWVSTNGADYILYPITFEFHSYVISMCLHGPLLALGLENGFLIVFHVQQPEDLENMSRLKLVWKKRLSPASIIAIDIAIEEKGPVILATTTSTMIAIRWENFHHR